MIDVDAVEAARGQAYQKPTRIRECKEKQLLRSISSRVLLLLYPRAVKG